MTFANRTEAGRSVAKKIESLKNKEGLLVLGMARGGVVVAFEVAAALRAPLDVFVVRKLGVPGHEEMAFGAIASGGVRVLDQETIQSAGISAVEVELISAAEMQELERRERAYRGNRAPMEIQGRSVILVDDGIATGESMEAAIQAVRGTEAGHADRRRSGCPGVYMSPACEQSRRYGCGPDAGVLPGGF